MKKKLLGILLIISMVAAFMPAMAFAEENKEIACESVVVETNINEVANASEEPDVEQPSAENGEENIDSGEIEENLEKVLNSRIVQKLIEMGVKAVDRENIAKFVEKLDSVIDKESFLKILNKKPSDYTVKDIKSLMKAFKILNISMFIADNEIVQIQYVGDGKVNKPLDPVRTGYEFDYWTYDYFNYSEVKWDKHNKTEYAPLFFAKWNALEYTIIRKDGPKQNKDLVVKYGSKFIVENEFEGPEGKVFDYWSVEGKDGFKLQDNEQTTIAELMAAGVEPNEKREITLIANWTDAKKVVVTYDSNIPESLRPYISIDMTANDKAYVGEDYQIRNKIPKFESVVTEYYDMVAQILKELNLLDIDVFMGWNTEADGTGTTYQPGDIIENVGEEPITLYAMWKMKFYTVKYELNGGDPSSIEGATKCYLSGLGTLCVLPTTPTKEGYEFDGWYFDPEFKDGPVTNFDNSTVGNKVMYAKWKKAEYTITFIDGFGGVFTFTQGYGEKTMTPPTPHRSGLIFKGWKNFSEIVTDNATYYADWKFSMDMDVLGGVATGDTNSMLPYACAGVAALGILVVMVARRRKSNNQ